MGVDVYVQDMPWEKSGYLDWDDSGAFIVVNAAHSLVRQRFSCAHELGHLSDFMNRGVRRSADRDHLASQGRDADEIYANKYAAALLMPKNDVARLFTQGLNTDQLASRFKVSSEAMQWRLVNLGLAR